MVLHAQLIVTAPSRQPLPQDAPPMRAPAKPALAPCWRSPRWTLGRVGSPWPTGLVPA